MFYQIFLSTQVKRSAIISNKHDIYELPHKLPSDLRPRIFFLGKVRKISKLHRIITQYPVPLPKKDFVDTSKKLLKNRKLSLISLFHMKTSVCLKYFVNYCCFVRCLGVPENSI